MKKPRIKLYSEQDGFKVYDVDGVYIRKNLDDQLRTGAGFNNPEDIRKQINEEIIRQNPEKITEVPTEFLKYLRPKLKPLAKMGVLENLKTFEEYELYDTYLEDSNNVKELLSHYNLKYNVVDDKPVLTIVFPYSDAMYGGRWTDVEYKLLTSFLKELLRHGYKFKVKEVEESTTVSIDFDAV